MNCYINALKEMNASEGIIAKFTKLYTTNKLNSIMEGGNNLSYYFTNYILDDMVSVGAEINDNNYSPIPDELKKDIHFNILDQFWDELHLSSLITISFSYKLNSELPMIKYRFSKLKDISDDSTLSNIQKIDKMEKEIRDNDILRNNDFWSCLIVKFNFPRSINEAKDILRLIQFIKMSDGFDWLDNDHITNISLYEYYKALGQYYISNFPEYKIYQEKMKNPLIGRLNDESIKRLQDMIEKAVLESEENYLLDGDEQEIINKWYQENRKEFWNMVLN